MLALLALAVAQAVISMPVMPNPMASHFNGSGVPNGWSTPQQFFGGILVIELLVAAAFMLMSPFSKLSDQRINLPHKDYWLAPQRRAATIARLQAIMLEFGLITMALLIYAVHLSIAANLRHPPLLSSHIIIALLLYVVGTLLWVVRLYLAFSRTSG
jgi:uncharacterized membrane protein